MNPIFVALFAIYGVIIAAHLALRYSGRGGIPVIGVVLLVAWMLFAALGMWALPVTVIGIALLFAAQWRVA